MKYAGGQGTSNYEYGVNNVPVACTRHKQAGTEVVPGHANAKAAAHLLSIGTHQDMPQWGRTR